MSCFTRLRVVPALLASLLAWHGCAHAGWLRSARAPGGGRNVSLRYEGSCAELACCSAHGVSVAAETRGAFACHALGQGSSCGMKRGWFAPGFTCNPREPHRYRQPQDPPYLACDDNERWLSLPALSHGDCGESYLVCYRGVRVLAFARDRSAPNDSGKVHFEGSLGLLRAIGADPGQRETVVSIYALHERDAIAADPHCTGE